MKIILNFKKDKNNLGKILSSSRKYDTRKSNKNLINLKINIFVFDQTISIERLFIFLLKSIKRRKNILIISLISFILQSWNINFKIRK
jgi:hypothetical protein